MGVGVGALQPRLLKKNVLLFQGHLWHMWSSFNLNSIQDYIYGHLRILMQDIKLPFNLVVVSIILGSFSSFVTELMRCNIFGMFSVVINR